MRIVLGFIFALLIGCNSSPEANIVIDNGKSEVSQTENIGGKEVNVTMKTSKGDININLFADQTALTVMNFVNLAERGYYDGLIFHRVIEDFMIQGGCPEGTGRGTPGYRFEDEFVDELRHDQPGVLSMANAGPRSNGSQFFITHVQTGWLDGKHTVFGKVVGEEYQAVVDSIVQGDKIIEVIVDGDISEIKEKYKERLDEWNATLDSRFSDLKEAK